jgi:hypothetical protein
MVCHMCQSLSSSKTHIMPISFLAFHNAHSYDSLEASWHVHVVCVKILPSNVFKSYAYHAHLLVNHFPLLKSFFAILLSLISWFYMHMLQIVSIVHKELLIYTYSHIGLPSYIVIHLTPPTSNIINIIFTPWVETPNWKQHHAHTMLYM